MSFFNTIFGSSEDEPTSSKVNWRKLIDLGQLNEIINESTQQTIIIFKHSTRCSISRFALKQFESEFDLEDKVIPYYLDLLNHRDVSNAIQERFGVVHQSPQLILIQGGKATYDTSHDAISVADLKRSLD